MFILVDDEDRENEGDLVIPAQMATPDAINFMAKHGRGLICLAMTRERIDQLGLPLMPRHNDSRLETAFTISIEAKEGVTTGISAADRARTISVAIDARKAPEHLVTPGHVFPLVARDGGVLVRAGHTEAAVDVARLAGLNPSGVICEIMREDGTMARMDDLFGFAQLHSLKIGTIRDLIAYRLKKDRLVIETAEARSRAAGAAPGPPRPSSTRPGRRADRPGQGPGRSRSRPWCGCTRSACSPTPSPRPAARGGLLEGAMKTIAEEGAGVMSSSTGRCPTRCRRRSRCAPGRPRADGEQLRDYGVGAQILAALGVHDMILLTNSHHTPVALAGYGLAIVGERPIPGSGAA